MSLPVKLSFIGFGNMASALVAGAIHAGAIRCDQIMISSPRYRQGIKKSTFTVALSNRHAAQWADMIVLGTKPPLIAEVCHDMATVFQNREKKPLIVSLAAGVTTHAIQTYLGCETMPVLRVMPNTPVSVGLGASGLYANPFVSEGERDFVTTLMASTGLVMTVNDERDLDKITAISGSGPAYFLLMQEMLVKSAKKLGLSEEVAIALVQQTMLGTSVLTGKSGLRFETSRHAVTSPGGTTEAAVACFIDKGFEHLVDDAVHAAYQRAECLRTRE